jgi:GT2 family glycosyltransferase
VSVRASIVVSTLDRATFLRKLLARLETLDHPAYEVVVVNGPSRDDTAAVLATYDGRVKTLHCPVANLSRSRNLGIGAAAGDVVAFIDDDALPRDPAWLRGLCDAITDDPGIAGAGGPVLTGDAQAYEFEGRVIGEYGELYPPFEAAARGIAVDGVRWVAGVQGVNCAFRRDALLAVGGFDEAYVYCFDETDVCMRVARGGARIAYAPRSAVLHFSASGERRRSPYDRAWNVIAAADAYFAVKNARAPLPARVLRTLRLARSKWSYWQINAYYHEGRYGAATRLRYLGRWARGVVAGAWHGITIARRTPLGSATPPPPPFRPFRA